ncbi:MAG TPA: hypothetical protein VGM05_05455 [Planctomycetaceae bacterium]
MDSIISRFAGDENQHIQRAGGGGFGNTIKGLAHGPTVRGAGQRVVNDFELFVLLDFWTETANQRKFAIQSLGCYAADSIDFMLQSIRRFFGGLQPIIWNRGGSPGFGDLAGGHREKSLGIGESLKVSMLRRGELQSNLGSLQRAINLFQRRISCDIVPRAGNDVESIGFTFDRRSRLLVVLVLLGCVVLIMILIVNLFTRFFGRRDFLIGVFLVGVGVFFTRVFFPGAFFVRVCVVRLRLARIRRTGRLVPFLRVLCLCVYLGRFCPVRWT